MELGLQGLKAIVTGATRGIGFSIAECLAKEGCNLAICARNHEQVSERVSSLENLGIRAYGTAVDVGNIKDFCGWIEQAANQLGGLDIFVSNVSAQSFDWEESFRVDILACTKGIEAVIPFLKSSKNASIVAISSQAAMLSVPSYKPYASMKAALLNYMSSLSRELAPHKIRVNSVSPGEIYFKGGFWHRMEKEDPDLFETVMKKNIFGRLGTPEEVARAAVFLSSPAASWISGSNLMVDGVSREYVQY